MSSPSGILLSLGIEHGAMDGSIVVGQAYRLARFSIHCRRQCLPIGYVPNILFRQECAEVPGLKGSVADNDGYIDG